MTRNNSILNMLKHNQSRLRLGIATSLSLALSACSTFEYHETKVVEVNQVNAQQEANMDENELLDIGVVLFDDGVDTSDDFTAAYSSVRQSEAVWFSNQLKKSLELSNAWGLVRMLPNENSVVDVLVTGTLLESNGEVITLKVRASDVTGAAWIEKEYHQRASSYAYNPEIEIPGDPFSAVFSEIANDLFDFRASLTTAQRFNIRAISKIRFAQEFAPLAFEDFLVQDELGQYELARIPAASDPMMLRVEQIRARNDLFLDVVQDYYRAFNLKMEVPYNEWRKLSYKEVVYERQLKEQARKEKIAGIVAIAGGIAAATEGSKTSTRIGGHAAMIGGANVFARSFRKREQAASHSDTLRELGSTLESELEPSIIDLQDRSVTLSGTVEDQFKEWKRILSRMFEVEQGEFIDKEITLQSEISSGQTASTQPDAESAKSDTQPINVLD